MNRVYSIVVSFLFLGLTLGMGGDVMVAADTGDPVKKADGQKGLAKDELPVAKAKLAELEKIAAAKAQELANLKTEIDALRQSIATAERPKDKVYRKAEELLADMPKDAYPKFGKAFGLERAAARKWVKANLVGRTLEWTTTVTEVEIKGDGPFSVHVSGLNGGPTVQRADPKKGSPTRDRSFSLGGPFTLGGQACDVLVGLDWSTPYTTNCTAEEAAALRKLNGQKVTLRATVTDADVGDSGVYEFKNQGGLSLRVTQERVPIVLDVTLPAIDGFPRTVTKVKGKE